MTKDLTGNKLLHLIRKRGTETDKLLSILLDIQEASGRQCVDEEAAALVAQELSLPLSQVYEALTFYSMLRTEPVARYIIEVCGSVSCHFNHADKVTVLLEYILDIPMGGSTPDGIFALRRTACVGACDRGPVMKIGDTVYDGLDEGRIRAVLDGLREAARNEGRGAVGDEDE